MFLNLVLSAGFVAAAAASAAQCRRGRRQQTSLLLVQTALPLVIYVLAASFFSSLYQAPYLAWNAARLAPAVAWVHGRPLYSTEDAGSVQTTMYPPLAAIAYAPAAVFPEPTSAVLAGNLLAHLYYFLPVLFLCLARSRDRRLGLLLFSLFTTLTFGFWGLAGSASFIHADAPALGLGLASCLVLSRTESSQQTRFGVSAALAWLSVLSKQPLLPLVGVLALWVLLSEGWRQAFRFSAWLISIGMATVTLLLALFPLDGLLFNTVLIPREVPWLGSFPSNLAYAFLELQAYLLPIALILAGCVILLLRDDPASKPSAWLARNDWVLPLTAGLILLPVSVLGRVKIGGALNNFSYTLYFGVAAVLMIVLRLLRLWDEHKEAACRTACVSFVALSSILVAVYGFQRIIGDKLHLLSAERNENRQAYEYLVRHRDSTAYFPGQPLAHWLAGEALPHFSLAVYDRDTLTPYPLRPAQIRAHVPANLSKICIGQDFRKESEHLVNSHFPDFGKPLDGHGPFTCVGRR